jgi:hypothetical protein
MNLLSAESIRAIGYSAKDGPDRSTRFLDVNKDLLFPRMEHTP